MQCKCGLRNFCDDGSTAKKDAYRPSVLVMSLQGYS